jgi:hypothetical protein
MRSGGGLHDIKSSLPLQVAVYFNWFYSCAFFFVTLLLLIYKGRWPNTLGDAAGVHTAVSCPQLSGNLACLLQRSCCHTLKRRSASRLRSCSCTLLWNPFGCTSVSGCEVLTPVHSAAPELKGGLVLLATFWLRAWSHRKRWRKRPRPQRPPRHACVPRFCSAASRGNKTESVSPLMSSLLIAVLVIIFHVYYLRLQTYV